MTYGSKQFQREDLDVVLAEVTFGPAFDLGRFGIENAAIGVYGIVSGVVLGGNFYSAGIGAGTGFVLSPARGFSCTALEYRHKDYQKARPRRRRTAQRRRDPRLYGASNYIVWPTLLYRQRLCAARFGPASTILTYTEGGLLGRSPRRLRLADPARGTLDRLAECRR